MNIHMEVTKNLLGIEKKAELNREEEWITKKAIIEIFEKDLLSNYDAGSFQMLQFIHTFIFKDIYDWAGKIRDVNISKDNFSFAPAMYLGQSLEIVENMPQNTFDEIIEKYAEMNVVHPFREGNGRATRIWLDQILKNTLELVIDWNDIDKQEYLAAMSQSHVNTRGLKDLIQAHLTPQIDNKELFFKGIDSSYWYEGLNEYKTMDVYYKKG